MLGSKQRSHLFQLGKEFQQKAQRIKALPPKGLAASQATCSLGGHGRTGSLLDWVDHPLQMATYTAFSCSSGWSKPMVPMGAQFGVGEFITHFRIYFRGDWDVHWGYELLTHAHLGVVQNFRARGIAGFNLLHLPGFPFGQLCISHTRLAE